MLVFTLTFFQVQERLQESSHKLDLLKLSLELRAMELPRGSAERMELERELNIMSPTRYRSAGDHAKAGAQKNETLGHNCVISKPAELTG